MADELRQAGRDEFEAGATRAGRPRSAPGPVKPAEAKRLRILAAAAQLFSERGFGKTRVEQISVRAKVSKGLVYVHFPSKEALLEAVLSDALTRWGAASREAATRAGPKTEDRLSAFLRSSIRYAEKSPVLRAILAQDPRVLLPGRHDHSDELAEAYVDAVRALLAGGIARGEIRRDLDPDHAASIIWILHSALIREIFIDQVTRAHEQPDRLVETTIEILITGLRGPEITGPNSETR